MTFLAQPSVSTYSNKFGDCLKKFDIDRYETPRNLASSDKLFNRALF